MSSRVTLADVARLAGVSKTSASMALSDSSRVATITKTAVRKAASELGYVPHFAASALVGESMVNPGKYFHNNVCNGLNLLQATLAAGIKRAGGIQAVASRRRPPLPRPSSS